MNFVALKKSKENVTKEVKREIGEMLKEIRVSLPDMEIDKKMRSEILMKVSSACYGSCDFVEFKHGMK